MRYYEETISHCLVRIHMANYNIFRKYERVICRKNKIIMKGQALRFPFLFCCVEGKKVTDHIKKWCVFP